MSAPVQATEWYFLGGGDSVLSEMSEKVCLEGIEGYIAGGVCAGVVGAVEILQPYDVCLDACGESALGE